MLWAFLICLYITIFIITTFFGYVLIQKFYYKIRLRVLMKESEQPKKDKQKETKVPIKVSPYGKFLQKLGTNLEAAAIPLTPKEFLAILLGFNVLILLIGTIVSSFAKTFILCIVIDFVLFRFLPRFQKRKKQKMVQQLPDALDLISNALKTGYSIVQTLDLVSKENFSPLSDEFAKLIQALKYGEPFEKAFTELAARLDIPELKTVVDTILITRETGGNMTHVIDGLLEMMRENQRLQGEVKALTAQGRISSWVIGSLPLFLFALLTMISPEYMLLLFKHPLGIVMVIVAAISQIIGYAVMHKLIQLKVR
jgi:tight adherence protein B